MVLETIAEAIILVVFIFPMEFVHFSRLTIDTFYLWCEDESHFMFNWRYSWFYLTSIDPQIRAVYYSERAQAVVCDANTQILILCQCKTPSELFSSAWIWSKFLFDKVNIIHPNAFMQHWARDQHDALSNGTLQNWLRCKKIPAIVNETPNKLLT